VGSKPSGRDSDFALLFVGAQFALDGDVSRLESVPAKSASFPRRIDATRSAIPTLPRHSSTTFWWRGITAMMAASPPRSLCRLSPRVAMVEAAQARQGNQTGISRWPWPDRASIGCVFVQRLVNAILSVIAHVVADQTAKVFFVHWDDMVEDLTAAASIHLSAVPFCHGA
jgi:hypothetical protein